ncbi:uncharacterized protein LOC131675742 isoform X2 [Phymastichus coffea]|uniref:uncharacterized protein LOC131675742 isoform X2 n=1 Tax=Phymastichus coffea TaxID=108790 RepID=UPI00273AB6F7|nr:uncharacterized protein LOC131675742 isoform X2 [Phymastichus coffea]
MGTKSSWTSESSSSDSGASRQRLKVLYDFEYETRGKRVRIVKDEQLVLVRKTNDDWWQVVRAADLAGSYYVPEQATFYVPTGYVGLQQPSDQLPDGTRFYVDKDKMFKAAEPPPSSSSSSSSSSGQSRKTSHDSFKSKVIRKLSGNLSATSQQSDGSGDKPTKAIKHSRKNSNDTSDEPALLKHHHWESSTFAMCFGRDNKSANEAQLNPFQEELENALSSRVSQRRLASSASLRNVRKEQPPPADSHQPAADSTFESIHDKWQKVSALSCNSSSQRQQQIRKVSEDNSTKKAQALPTIKESKSPNASPAKTPNEPVAIRRASRLPEEKSLTDDREPESRQRSCPEEQRPSSVAPAQDNGLDIINDKRKMWAIETLMSELMQSSSMAVKTLASEASNATKSVSGAKQLAQELHDMSVSRREAEIQVNLLDDVQAEEENGRQRELKAVAPKAERRMFDFVPRSQAVRSSSARSPKLLDEYNEANILSEAAGERAAAVNSEKRRGEERVRRSQSSPESPSYSSVPLRLRRDNVPSLPQQSNMPSKADFRNELQLSPSLEKLASEIKFLPASWKGNDSDRLSQEVPTTLDWPQTTTLSQDSLRLYKRRSKSEPQLLQRKSRSLGDLDCSEMDEREQLELRRRYKPVPKLRSKDSFKKILLSFHKPNTTFPLTGPAAAARPVPAKRRVHQQQQQPYQHHTPISSCDDLDQIDIERSTAVGFKSLLRASDSGSEECLQSKTFPSLPSLLILNRPHQNLYEQKHNHSQQQNASNDNLSSSRSLSSETILSSSSASARILDEPELDNIVDLPPGWRQIYDNNAKRFCFLNDRGDKWFSSNDAEGKIYFFEENSNESSWALPAIANERRVRTISNGDWPQLFDGNMCILKEGVINKTKITTENGKKLRKAWSLSYAVLTELFLLFFKDAKTFAAMKMDQSAAAKPDITVDLNGAFIEPIDKLSNRKNVYLINTILGLQVLIQSDNALAITEWYKEINDAILRLPFSQECRRTTSSKQFEG